MADDEKTEKQQSNQQEKPKEKSKKHKSLEEIIEEASRKFGSYATDIEQAILEGRPLQGVIQATAKINIGKSDFYTFLGAKNAIISFESLTKLYQMMAPKGRENEFRLDNGKSAHGLTKEQIRELPKFLHNPLAVFKSETKQDSILLVTSLKDVDHLPIVIPIHLAMEGNRLRAHLYKSAYGRDNFERTFNRWIKGLNKNDEPISEPGKSLLIYLDTKHIEYLNSIGIDFPENWKQKNPLQNIAEGLRLSSAVRSKGLVDTILTDVDFVNYQEEIKRAKLEQITQNSKQNDQKISKDIEKETPLLNNTDRLQLSKVAQTKEESENLQPNKANGLYLSNAVRSVDFEEKLSATENNVKNELLSGIKRFDQEFINGIIQAIQENKAPWQKDWDRGQIYAPHNGASQRLYSGKNAIHLAITASRNGYDDPRWGTFQQIKELGGKINHGEKGTGILFFKEESFINKNNEIETKKIIRYHTVFNFAQTNLPALDLSKKPNLQPNLSAFEDIIQRHQPKIKSGEPAYSPNSDTIYLPPKTSFKDDAGYYATALHEMAHWTGHSSRLNRDLSGKFGTPEYAKEELIAELSSYMTALESGLPFKTHNTVAYLQHWTQKTGTELTESIQSAFLIASEAKNYILGQDREHLIDLKQERFITSHQEAPLINFEQKTQTPQEIIGAPLPLREKENFIRDVMNSEIARETAIKALHIQEKIYLAVPFSEKDYAKYQGALWDNKNKSWYTENIEYLPQLQKYLPNPENPSPEHQKALQATQNQSIFIENQINTFTTFQRASFAKSAYLMLENVHGNEPFLQEKGIKNLYGLKRLDDGSIVMPLIDGQKMVSLETITPQGEVFTMKQTNIENAYFPIGNRKNPERIWIAENLPIAEALFQKEKSDKILVIAGSQHGNLEKISEQLTKLYPQAEILKPQPQKVLEPQKIPSSQAKSKDLER